MFTTGIIQSIFQRIKVLHIFFSHNFNSATSFNIFQIVNFLRIRIKQIPLFSLIRVSPPLDNLSFSLSSFLLLIELHVFRPDLFLHPLLFVDLLSTIIASNR